MDIRTATNAEIIEALDIKKELIDRHYEITTEFCDVSDITGEEAVEFISELLYDEFGGKFEDYDYERKACEILEIVADEVINKIFEEDEKASEDYEAMLEGRKGDY